MKTIGLIGGMSWESTATYYRLINEGVKAKLGGTILPNSFCTALISPRSSVYNATINGSKRGSY